ncbi:MAG: cupin domain-containing protein [Ignavibacteriales bacterium]
MFIGHLKDVESKAVAPEVLKNVYKQTAIGPAQGWEGWVMRVFTVGPDCASPRHRHPWPHINYVISGNGILYLEGKENYVETGSIAYIPADAEHQFMNRSDKDLVFICIVPEEGDK